MSLRGGGTIHVVPINDIREHEDSRACWCGPLILENDPDLPDAVTVVHNSADGRELVEKHGLQ